MSMGRRRGKKDGNTELDLVAFISLLSVCICFLLLTTIWIQIGSMNVKQSVGAGTPSGKPQPTLMVSFDKSGGLKLQVENATKLLSRKERVQMFKPSSMEDLSTEVASRLKSIRSKVTTLDTALVQPVKQTNFESIITVMDSLRESGMSDLGVSPL